MSWLRSLIHKLNTPRHEALLVLLALLIVLRIPNLLEPYWYGDETIYLIIGNAMRHGVKLYSEIIDHKTPLIYYLAMVPNQVSFRVLMMVWMMATTVGFYYIALRLSKSVWPTFLASLFFVLLTSLPTLEGNIPNGELFMMGFVVLGLQLLLQTSVFSGWLDGTVLARPWWRDTLWLVLAGFSFGLAILTKVPALFDAVGVLSLAWFASTHSWWRSRKHWLETLKRLIGSVGVVGITIVAVILLSVLYFVLRGSGQAYLDYGLLYNFRYAASWNPEFNNKIVAWAFTLPGKVSILATLGLLLSLATRRMTARTAFVSFWFVASLVAATLSNRPYPHYMIQVILPLSLLLALLLTQFSGLNRKNLLKQLPLALTVYVIPVLLLAATWHYLGFTRYPSLSYYQTFAQLLTGKLSYEAYTYSFNPSIEDNQQIIKIFNSKPNTTYYVWGTNPILYAQHRTVPLGRFTVAFHVKDFQAYDEMLQLVKAQSPEYILVMNDDADSFPALSHYLRLNYMPNDSFKTMVLWKKMTR